jgi:hypothetical protein
MSQASDANGVLAIIYDHTNRQLTVTQLGGSPSNDYTVTTDFDGAWVNAFDPATNSLRAILVS